MRPPLIGITLDNVDNTAASGRYEAGVGYSAAVTRAGGLPVLLPHEPERVGDYVALCDGLVLTGGVDPDTAALPADWPGCEPVHPSARLMDPRRQAFELALLAEMDRAKPDAPLLGICLGMQLLALHHGGRLNQYLPDTHPPEVVARHRQADHAVRVVVEDGVLALGSPATPGGGQPLRRRAGSGAAWGHVIHSHHQQAIADAGFLRVAAVAEDGIIEAVDDPARPYRVGVQWHPERSDGALNRGLFERLVDAAGGGF